MEPMFSVGVDHAYITTSKVKIYDFREIFPHPTGLDINVGALFALYWSFITGWEHPEFNEKFDKRTAHYCSMFNANKMREKAMAAINELLCSPDVVCSYGVENEVTQKLTKILYYVEGGKLFGEFSLTSVSLIELIFFNFAATCMMNYIGNSTNYPPAILTVHFDRLTITEPILKAISVNKMVTLPLVSHLGNSWSLSFSEQNNLAAIFLKIDEYSPFELEEKMAKYSFVYQEMARALAVNALIDKQQDEAAGYYRKTKTKAIRAMLKPEFDKRNLSLGWPLPVNPRRKRKWTRKIKPNDMDKS